MDIIRNFSPSGAYCGLNTAVTLGTFDGVHLGHQNIIKKVIEYSRTDQITSAVVTFDRHPMTVINPENAPHIITTLEEKLDLFGKIGIDTTFVVSFTKEISEITAESFIESYLLRCLGMRYFVVGYDHGFGKNRDSSSDILSDYARTRDFRLVVQQPVMVDHVVVKSSTIRQMIASGNIEIANRMLGSLYSLCGTVVQGNKIGRELGFPTANVIPDQSEKIIPGSGVYAGFVHVGPNSYKSAICIGSQPTFSGDKTTIEAFLLDYNNDLYGQTVILEFKRKLRDLVKFDSTDDLIKQIQFDVNQLI